MTNDYNNPINVLNDVKGRTEDISKMTEKATENAAAMAEFDKTIHSVYDDAEETETPCKPKEKQHLVLSTEVEEDKSELIVELSKVYEVDGEEIESIDLTGLEDISQSQQDKVNKLYKKITKTVSTTPELTTEYAVAMTHVLTGIPLEVVKQFTFKDKIRLKNAIMVFLYGED